MSNHLGHSVMHALAHQAHKESHKGNHSRANGIWLILLGFFLLPVPIVGVPLMIWGFAQALEAPSNDEAAKADDSQPAE